MKTRQARIEALDRAIPTPPLDVRHPLPGDSLVEIRTLWQDGENMLIGGHAYPPEAVILMVLMYMFGAHDTLSVEMAAAAIWPVLTAPDVPESLLIDLFKQGRAINAQVLASGQNDPIATMRYRWRELFRKAAEEVDPLGVSWSRAELERKVKDAKS